MKNCKNCGRQLQLITVCRWCKEQDEEMDNKNILILMALFTSIVLTVGYIIGFLIGRYVR